MNKVNGIRIFCVLTILFVIGCYQILNLKSTKDAEIIETEQIAEEEAESETTEDNSVPVSQVIDYKFVIVEESDYLIVYYSDLFTVYEYTDIRYSDLEDSLRQKIRKGYHMKDEKELFDFLEDYTS